MISVSQEVIDLINADSRTFRAKFKHGDSVYDKIMSLKWNVCLPSSSFSVGNALSIGIQCTAFDVPVSIKGEELELVITIEGSADEISIGSFTAEKPTIQNGIVSFNAYDDMSRAGNIPYNSTLGEGKHTVNQYVADVAETLGIGYISLGSEGEVTVENDYLSGNSCRNALAYLAGYLGRNCVIKNKKISMKKFTLVDYTMNADRIEEPELEDIDSEIDFIIAQISSNNTIMNGNGATGTELVCPIMIESQLSNVANMLLGADSPVKNYRAGKIKLLLGDPRLELCDVIKLDYKDAEYIIPITSISFEYDGGLMTDIEAYALKEPTLLTPSQRLDFAVQEEVKKVLEQLKNIDGIYFYIRYSPNADGSNMTEEPDDKTEYIGVCSTNQSSAPGEVSAYTWSKFKGTDGSSNFFHVKYSNDGGKTFTGTNGETAGEYIGILVDSNEDDSTNPSDYTWSKIVGNDGRGVSKVETEYRLSTSDTSLSSGYTWGTDAPTWQDGLFLWTRLVTYYTDGTNTPSDPVVDASWKKTSVVDAASKELNETLANALGLYVTEENGVRYYHSVKPLESCGEGSTILMLNAGAFGVCTTGWNGGNPDFQYGTAFEKGEAVWNILAANKISADLIEAGSIKSLPSAKVQTTINLDDGTISSTNGETSVKIQGGYTDENGVTYPAGIALESETEDRHFMFTPSELSFTTIEYLLALLLHELNPSRNPKPEDPYFSSVKERDIKTTNIHCKNIYISVSDGEEESLLDALSMMSEQVNLLSESLTALQEKYLVLEEALGQQHEHTPATAVRENVVSATCTAQGSYDEVVYCSSCGEKLSITKKYTSALGHNYTSVVTPPTSTSGGYTTHTCQTCGSSYTDNYTDAIKYFTATIYSSGAGSGDVVRIAKNTSGEDWGKNQFSVGDKFCFYAEANSGKVISSVQVTSNGVMTTYSAKDLEDVGALTAARTKLTYPYNLITVTSALLGTSISMTVLFEEPMIYEGVETSVNIPAKNSYVFLKFIPNQSGSYVFESLNQVGADPDGMICDVNQIKIDDCYDDNSGADGGFSVTYDGFEANTVYYLAARLYKEPGTLTVKVSYNSSSGGSSGGGSTETRDIAIGLYGGGYHKVVRNGAETFYVYEGVTRTFDVGDVIEITYYPESGKRLGYWYVDDEQASEANPYTVTVGTTVQNEIYNTWTDA